MFNKIIDKIKGAGVLSLSLEEASKCIYKVHFGGK